MRRLRSIHRVGARAIALLLASIVCAGATGLGHTTWDDPSCDPVPVHHDHNAHRFSSGRLPAAPADNHCLACHSLRLLRAGLVAIHAVIIDGAQFAAVGASDVVLSTGALLSTAPSRAPPVVLL